MHGCIRCCGIGALAARLIRGVGRWRIFLLGLGLLLLLLEALHDWWDMASGWVRELLGGWTVDGRVIDGCSEFLGMVVGGLWAVVDWLVRVCYWGLLGLLVRGAAGGSAVARIGGLGGWRVTHLLSAVVWGCAGFQRLSVCLVC